MIYCFIDKDTNKYIQTINTGKIEYKFLQYMQENLYSNEYLTMNLKWMHPFQLDKTYYVVNSDCTEFYVFSVHKGFCFYDVAEHDDRVIIARLCNLSKERAHII